MSKVQVIEQDGKPTFYVVPADIWLRVREMVEDAEDAAAIDEFDRTDDGVRYPLAVSHAMCEGATPLRAWREHRGMSTQALADAAGVSRPYVTQIETAKRAGTASTLAKLARVLDVPVGALVPL